MKKIIIAFFLLLVNLFLFKKTIFAEWIKYPTPVISFTLNSWDSLNVSSPSVICENNICRLWYGGESKIDESKIGMAESSDGLRWQKFPANPLILPSTIDGIKELGVGEPSVVHNDKYRLWYTSIATNGIYRIGYAESVDGINWVKYNHFVLTGEKNWEAKGVSHPFVIWENGVYYMWYAGWGYGSPFQMGYAFSYDGITWEKYAQNPLSLPNLGHIGAPSVIKIDNLYHLFYHTGDSIPTAIYRVVSEDKINWHCYEPSCLVIKNSSAGFDSKMIAREEIFFYLNKLFLLYGGYNGSNWQIGLASPEPLPEKNNPLIIIPGFMASWNKEAILHQQPTNFSQWTILPFVKEYNGLIQTLKNLNYQENIDFFTFPYDWRKSVEQSADDLKLFIEQKSVLNNKFYLIGHSLGGLVARIYAQKYGLDRIEKIISLGSPHQGTAQVYEALESGDVKQENNFLWLASKIILMLNKDGFQTDKQTLERSFPVLKDLFPIYNFLFETNNSPKDINDLTIKNDLFLNYKNSFPTIFPSFYSFVGQKGQTLSGYLVDQPTPFEQILNLYPDGKPISSLYMIGDLSVTTQSAAINNNDIFFNLDHGELIYKSAGIKKILETLLINYQNSQISEGEKTSIQPSLIFFILSPATMELNYQDKVYLEYQGMIWLSDFSSGPYWLKVKGQEPGKYTIVIFQINQSQTEWSTINGVINSNSPQSQIDNYYFYLNPNQLEPPQLALENLFTDLINYLSDLNQNDNNHLFLKLITDLKETQNIYKDNQLMAKFLFFRIDNDLLKLFHDSYSLSPNKIITAFDKLENLYGRVINLNLSKSEKEKLLNDYSRLQKKWQREKEKILKNKKTPSRINLGLIEIIEKRVLTIKDFIDKQNFKTAEIYLISLSGLIKEIL
ncbi:MAG: alpha/beta fold hydrolase [Microgenomates group bacterium]|nr:alpha/beta fold hydrolase [Microgenomates group bacterium]